MIAKRLRSKWFSLLLITAAALWIAGCGPVKPPSVTDISVEPGTDILPGETGQNNGLGSPLEIGENV